VMVYLLFYTAVLEYGYADSVNNHVATQYIYLGMGTYLLSYDIRYVVNFLILSRVWYGYRQCTATATLMYGIL
jgi:hypothetical protein